MKIIIDGIFFQIANTGIARVWRTLLEKWRDSGFIENIILLDRGHTAPQLEGVRYYHLPPFNYDDEALLSNKIQDICDQFNADLFISTYYTTPLSTPSILMIHDLIPEVIGLDLNEFWWQEKRYAILHAVQYIAVSNNTAQDLRKFYPEVQPSQVNIIPNGVDSIFSPASASDIIKIKNKFSINSPYLLLVGSRLSLNQYKNATILFKALNEWKEVEKITLVCVGGEISLEPELAKLSKNFDVCIIQPTDWELSIIYSGAIALVYPSLYEGFGLPILEAMACGCPVITCRNSSLPEVGGDGAIYIDGQDSKEMIRALEKIQNTEIRNTLIARGKEQAKKFSWLTTADKISHLCAQTIEDTASRSNKLNFISLWQNFRQCQAQERRYRLLVEEINAKNTEKNHTICYMQDNIEEKNQLISQLEDNIQEKNHTICHLQNNIEEKNQLISQLEDNIQEKNQTIYHLQDNVEEKNQLVFQLQVDNQHLKIKVDDLYLKIEELSDTKKTIKRLFKKALRKLFKRS